MRLRSSHFVFLMLLVCSAQLGEECALRLLTCSLSGHATISSASFESVAASRKQTRRTFSSPVTRARTTQLDPGAVTAHRTPWTMRQPALASTAVFSFTSFLRA